MFPCYNLNFSAAQTLSYDKLTLALRFADVLLGDNAPGLFGDSITLHGVVFARFQTYKYMRPRLTQIYWVQKLIYVHRTRSSSMRFTFFFLPPLPLQCSTQYSTVKYSILDYSTQQSGILQK